MQKFLLSSNFLFETMLKFKYSLVKKIKQSGIFRGSLIQAFEVRQRDYRFKMQFPKSQIFANSVKFFKLQSYCKIHQILTVYL